MLPTGLQAARAARAQISRIADGWPTETLDMMRLLTSDLVTNAVLHGEGDVRLMVTGAEHSVHVEVSDRNPHMRPAPGGSDSPPRLEGGHGLKIVAAFADEWGTSPNDTGKTVWFNLRYP